MKSIDRNAFADPSIPTFDQVIELIQESDDLTVNRKNELCSAFRTMARWINLRPAAIPAHPDFLRRHLNKMTPAGLGVTAKRMSNVKSAVLAGLRHLNLVNGACYLAPLSPEWQCLRDRFSDKYDWTSVSRFFRFCSANQINPSEVTDEVSERFLLALIDETLIRNPIVPHQNFCRAWNRLSGKIETWPRTRLTVPVYRNHYILPWEALPDSFKCDVDDYLKKLSCDDPLDINAPPRPLRPGTIRSYKYELRRAASALVHSGYPITEIRSLRDIASVENVEALLRFFLEQRDPPPLASASDLAKLLAKVARHWCKSRPEDIDIINRYALNLSPKRTGLSTRNRTRLAPLKDERNLIMLFSLPNKIRDEVVKRNKGTRKDALLMQHAVALSILTYCPLRIGNLTSIHIDKNLRWSGRQMSGKLILDFDEDDVKNHQSLSFPLPKQCVDLIRLYIQDYHLRLTTDESSYLFPSNRPDRHKKPSMLSEQLSKLIHRSTGLEVNPHLYRHLVHLIVLRRFPGSYTMVSRILGHKSLDTAISNYAGEDIALAMEAFQSLVSDTLEGRRGLDDIDLSKIAYNLSWKKY